MLITQNQVSIAAKAVSLVKRYCFECGFRELPWMNRYFSRLLEDGFDPELIRELITRTSFAPRPSYAYLDYLVGVCRRSGIRDIVDFYTKPQVPDDEIPR